MTQAEKMHYLKYYEQRRPNHPWFQFYTASPQRRWEHIDGCRFESMKRGIPGVYVLYYYDGSDLRVVYVGQSKCIKNRVTTHGRRMGWDYCKAVCEPDPRKRTLLEIKLIRRLRPELNRLVPSAHTAMRYQRH